MSFTYIRRAAVALALLAAAGCTVKNTEPPPLTGPSGLALTLSVNAIPDSISQDGGSQSSVKVTAIGPDGKPVSALPLRLDMAVGGVAAGLRHAVRALDRHQQRRRGDRGVYRAAGPGQRRLRHLLGTAGQLRDDRRDRDVHQLHDGEPGAGADPPGADRRDSAAGQSRRPRRSRCRRPRRPQRGLDHSTPRPARPGFGATQIVSLATAGTSATDRHGTGKTATTHVHRATANSYNVTLTVTNDRGCPPRPRRRWFASAPACRRHRPRCRPPVFTFSPAAPGVGETVFFNASTSTPARDTRSRPTRGHSATAPRRRASRRRMPTPPRAPTPCN